MKYISFVQIVTIILRCSTRKDYGLSKLSISPSSQEANRGRSRQICRLFKR